MSANRRIPRPLPHSAAVFLVILSSCQLNDRRFSETAVTACPAIAGETIRWIVPFTAGGGYDVYSRLLEPFYEEAIGAEIVIQNRPGAGGRLGASVIQNATPDGGTLGLVNALSVLASELTGLESDLAMANLTVLGRLAPAYPAWVTSAESDLRSLDDLLARTEEGDSVVVGLTDIGNTGFIAVSVAADLLGIDVAYVAGYQGSRETSMGLLRREFDLLGVTFESVADRVENGSLRPILQISDEEGLDHPSLVDVPTLAGPGGLAAATATLRGADPVQANALAVSVTRLFSTGRLVVGPAGMDPELVSCLADRLADVAADPDFIAATEQAQRAFAFQEPDTVLAGLEAMARDREALAQIFRRHAERVVGSVVGP